MVARLSLAGFVTHAVGLWEGPMEWMDLHGRHHGQYWLFKSEQFHVDMQTVTNTFTGAVSATTVEQPALLRPELSLEELVRHTKPAVVCLRALNGSGSGFLVTETGNHRNQCSCCAGRFQFAGGATGWNTVAGQRCVHRPRSRFSSREVTPPQPDFVFPYLSLVVLRS